MSSKGKIHDETRGPTVQVGELSLTDCNYTTILCVCVCLYALTGYVDGKCPLVIQFKVIQKELTF